MSSYRNECADCGDSYITEAWEPERCPFCEVCDLRDERNAAIARAERAEAQLDVRLPPGLFAEYTRLDLAWQSLVRDRDALRARAEAAEALAASRLDVSPEDAAVYREAMSISVDDISVPLGTVIAIRLDAALRAHAAKVSR